jgi:DNA-binding CsgD family transcriptional regulator
MLWAQEMEPMEKLAEIVSKRSTPGILIFDMDERLLYSNAEATALMAMDQGMAVGDGLLPGVPQGVQDLCRSVMAAPGARPDPQSQESAGTVVTAGCTDPLAVRAFRVGQTGQEQQSAHIVVLMERVVEKREPDFAKIQAEYGLSRKELEVLRLISAGCSNKEIGERMFISVFTVKDHVKHIMRKMAATSRAELVSRIQ